MKIETLISHMMRLSVLSRLWHWTTDSAQHHVTYEQFLTQNEQLTDSFVEAALGNDIPVAFGNVGVGEGFEKGYSLEKSVSEIKEYRKHIYEAKTAFETDHPENAEELINILDDVAELISKTLYLLKLK